MLILRLQEPKEFVSSFYVAPNIMASTTENKSVPLLSRTAFWDIDFNKLDLDRYPDFVIIRVFERGTMQDIDEIIKYFGEPGIINSLTKATSLLPRAVALAKKFFGLSTDQFSCYTPHQQARNYSMY